MNPWIHGSAAGAAASAATVCTYYVIIGGALRALLYLHDKVHTVAAEAAAPAAAPAAALAAAPAADPWIHGSISFIMNHIFYFEMKNTRCVENFCRPPEAFSLTCNNHDVIRARYHGLPWVTMSGTYD